MLYPILEPVRIALGRILDMDREVKERWRRNRHHHRGHGGLVGGVILAGIGVVLLLQTLGTLFSDDRERFWPLFLIGVGFARGGGSTGWGGGVWGGVVIA